MNHPFSFKKVAWEYIRRGYSVIPIGPDKRPLIPWREYQTRVPTESELSEWHDRYPDCNVGIVTGAVSGLFVVDIDADEGKDALKQYGIDWETIDAPVVRTSKGIHIYFRYRDGLGNTARILPGVDTRGHGGYVVAPPSVNGTGKPYAFDRGRHLFKKVPPEVPSEFVKLLGMGVRGLGEGGSITNNSTIYSYIGDYKCPPQENQALTPFLSPSVTQMSPKRHLLSPLSPTSLSPNCHPLSPLSPKMPFAREGERDEKLFHVAIQLAKAKTSPELMVQVLSALAMACDPPYDLKDVPAKVHSALSRGREALYHEVREWISSSSGVFHLKDIALDLDIRDRVQRQVLANCLAKLAKQGIIEKYGNARGVYRIADRDAAKIDLDEDMGDQLSLIFPFCLEDLYTPMPKNIIIVAGESDSGKTAFLLNFAVMNADQMPVRYMSSEMGVAELKSRITKFEDYTLDDFKRIDFRERSSNFADLVNPDGINIIDFLEIHQEHYLVGQLIKDIFDKLDKGIAVIALQKNRGRDVGKGGDATLEKARLYLTLNRGEDGNWAKIVKCKNWTNDTRNPNGLVMRYKLIKGCKFVCQGFWHRPQNEVSV